VSGFVDNWFVGIIENYHFVITVLLEYTPNHTKPHPGPKWRIFHITSQDIDDVISHFFMVVAQTVSLSVFNIIFYIIFNIIFNITKRKLLDGLKI